MKNNKTIRIVNTIPINLNYTYLLKIKFFCNIIKVIKYVSDFIAE